LDTSIVVPNQNLFKVASETTTFEDSFHLSNNVLKFGVQSITDLMVKPGIINLDFADVETVLSSMGKAMMGTGEAEGENRALTATDMALNNPLIDDYSLKGAKGLLVNITGGKDITLFEVDQAVNKIRAEVDPEAELIFGAIKDESLNGKMRVSIVATALDGQIASTNGVVNMVNRIQNRNSGYSENLFSKGPIFSNNTYNTSISGATALKLDEQFDTNTHSQSESFIEINKEPEIQSETNEFESSISTSEVTSEETPFEIDSIEQSTASNEEPLSLEEEYTPKLFSDEGSNSDTENTSETEEQKLFEQESTQEDDFEIPAFLRRQKF
jgi:cell division protein FtsZ